MEQFSLVTALCALPLVGALFLLFIRGDERITAMNSRRVALLTSGCAFLASLSVLARFDFNGSAVQFDYIAEWIPVFGTVWHIGVDGVSLLFLPLVSGAVFISVLAAHKTVLSMVREYMFLTLVFESFVLTALCSRNLIQGFVFYESALLPVFVMIAVWGVEKRAYSAFKFCFYNLAGLLALSAVLMYGYSMTGSSDAGVGIQALPEDMQAAFLAGLVFMFSSSLPLFPFHVWFVEIRTEASVSTSVLLSGALSGTGLFMFLRSAFLYAPDAMSSFGGYLSAWAVFSAVYAATVSLSRDDIGKTAGYVQLSQAGLLAAGIFVGSQRLLSGALFFYFAQTVSVLLYLSVEAALIRRFSAKELKSCTGLYGVSPALGAAFFAGLLALSAFPPTPSFVGEFLVFAGIFDFSQAAGFFAILSSVLAFAALLPLFPRYVLGNFNPSLAVPADLSGIERIQIGMLALVLAVAALCPGIVMRMADAAARALILNGGAGI